MVRAIRIQYEGAIYHVMARSNEKKRIFFNDKDRASFLSALVEMLERFDVVLYVFCLMPNHYHLVVQTLRGNLSQAMGWLQTTFTVRYNLWHQRAGHLFQGRFKAHLVEADHYAKKLVEYIHLNPVRPSDKQATIPFEKFDFLNHYSWSSHLNYLGICKNPPWLSLEWLKYWDENDTEAAHQKYRNAILEAFDKPVVPIWDDVKGGFVFGGEDFYGEIKKRVLCKCGNEEIQFSKRERAKTYLDEIQKIVFGEQDQRIKMWLRVRFGGERLVHLAKEFGYRDGSGVLQAIKSLERRTKIEEDLKIKMEKMTEALSRFRS